MDDADNIQRFLDAMVRKNLNAFTMSKPPPMKAKKEDEQSTSSTVDQLWELSGGDAIHRSSTGNPIQQPVDSVTRQGVEMGSSGGRKAAGPSTPMSPLSLREPGNWNTFQPTTASTSSKLPAAVANAAQLITNKDLTSPLGSGVRAPPSTPDDSSTADVQRIISDAFGDLKVGSRPEIALGSSKHAPTLLNWSDRSQENVRPSGADKDMPRFFSPAKFLSPEEKQKREESFQRILALTSPNLPNLKENNNTPATAPSVRLDDGSGILASRWAETHEGAFERRNSGSAAISTVDPNSKAYTLPVSSTAPLAPSQKVNSDGPTEVNAAPLSPSWQTNDKPSHGSSPVPSSSSPPVSIQGNARSTLPTAPAARSLSITATLTVTSPASSVDASTAQPFTPNPGPTIRQEPSASSVTGLGLRIGEPQTTNPGFKVFDKKPNVNETSRFFSSWPTLTGRDAARTQPPISSAFSKRLTDLHLLAARVRRVAIVNIPRDSSAKFVQSLVFGGPLELLTVGGSSASVVFMHAEHCVKYYDATSNGLVYKKTDGKEEVCFVQLAKDVDVVGGLLRGYIEKGVTRCVRAIGVDADWGMPALYKMAGRKGRKVEHIIDGVNAAGVSNSQSFFSPTLFLPSFLTFFLQSAWLI